MQYSLFFSLIASISIRRCAHHFTSLGINAARKTQENTSSEWETTNYTKSSETQLMHIFTHSLHSLRLCGALIWGKNRRVKKKQTNPFGLIASCKWIFFEIVMCDSLNFRFSSSSIWHLGEQFAIEIRCVFSSLERQQNACTVDKQTKARSLFFHTIFHVIPCNRFIRHINWRFALCFEWFRDIFHAMCYTQIWRTQ